MHKVPASDESLPPHRLRVRLPWLNRRASALICNGSVQYKIARFRNLEPAHVTLAKQRILPLLSVLTLALCMHAGELSLSREFYALGLVAILISAQVSARSICAITRAPSECIRRLCACCSSGAELDASKLTASRRSRFATLHCKE